MSEYDVEDTEEKLVVFGWAWFEVFLDEVVNDGISYGPRKPDFQSRIDDVSFIYVELYANKEDLDKIDWRTQ